MATSTLQREPTTAEAARAAAPFARPRVRLAPVEEVAAALDPCAAAALRPPPWVSTTPGWTASALGWFDADGSALGAVLVLRRHVPGTARFLAYLPSAPTAGSPSGDPGWLPAATAVLRREGAFAVRVGAASAAVAL